MRKPGSRPSRRTDESCYLLRPAYSPTHPPQSPPSASSKTGPPETVELRPEIIRKKTLAPNLALSRAFHAAHAPRQRLTQACAPGHPETRLQRRARDSVVSSIGLRKPGSSTLQVLLPPLFVPIHRPAGPSSTPPASQNRCGPAMPGPPSTEPPRLLFLLRGGRKPDETASAYPRTSGSICSHPPPTRPRRNADRAVLETRKAQSAFRPREAARCRHVAHAARIAMPSALQAGRPAAPCCHVAALRTDHPARHP